MYCFTVDSSETITGTWEDNHPEMCDRLPFNSGEELGE